MSWNHKMFWEVQQGHRAANTTKLLSGLRLLEKFNRIPTTVRAFDWLFIDAFQNVPQRKQKGRSKQWATMDCLRQLCTIAKTHQDQKVVSLAALSIPSTHDLRKHSRRRQTKECSDSAAQKDGR